MAYAADAMQGVPAGRMSQQVGFSDRRDLLGKARRHLLGAQSALGDGLDVRDGPADQA
jgi:hypothetical protein